MERETVESPSASSTRWTSPTDRQQKGQAGTSAAASTPRARISRARALSAPAPPRPPAGPASVHALPAAVLAASALFAGGLWLAHYPTWRTIAASLLLLSMTPRSSRAAVPAPPGTARPSLAPVLSTATHLGVVALTGGFHSPFLLAVVGPFTGLLQNYGWSRASQVALGLIAASALAMGLLPAAWFGPEIAEPVWSLSSGPWYPRSVWIRPGVRACASGSAARSRPPCFSSSPQRWRSPPRRFAPVGRWASR